MSGAPVTVGAGGVAVGLGVLIGAYVLWKASGAVGKLAGSAVDAVKGAASATVDAVGTAAQAVNPVNHENIFATGVNSLGAGIAGDANWTLGGAVYDWFNPAPYTPPFVPGIIDNYQGSW